MALERMHRSAADNTYLHKDFHGALSVGLLFLEKEYGADAVREYLRDFALHYHAPLRGALCTEGLAALRRYFEAIYSTEGATFQITGDADTLLLTIAACPALAHMRRCGHPISPLFHETGRSVYAALCEDTPFAYERRAYDPATGASSHFFSRRTPS